MPPALSQSPCVVREAGVLGVFFPNHPTPSRFNFSVSVTIRSCVNSQRKFPLFLSTLRYRDSGDLQGAVAPLPAAPRRVLQWACWLYSPPRLAEGCFTLRIHNTTAGPWDHLGGSLGRGAVSEDGGEDKRTAAWRGRGYPEASCSLSLKWRGLLVFHFLFSFSEI